jgi:hypothetical protein
MVEVMNTTEKMFVGVGVGAALGALLGYFYSQPKVVVVAPSPAPAPAATASAPTVAIPAAQTTSSSPPFGPSATLSAGTMTAMSTSPSTGPINLTVPTGGKIVSISSTNSKLLGTAAVGATSVSINGPSVGLYYDSTAVGSSGNLTVNWTDASGTNQLSTVPVSVTA